MGVILKRAYKYSLFLTLPTGFLSRYYFFLLPISITRFMVRDDKRQLTASFIYIYPLSMSTTTLNLTYCGVIVVTFTRHNTLTCCLRQLATCLVKHPSVYKVNLSVALMSKHLYYLILNVKKP